MPEYSVYINKDGWVCDRFPYDLNDREEEIPVSEDEYFMTFTCPQYYAWRVVEGKLECQQYEVKQWTDAERTAERASLHEKTDDDCMKYLRNIRLNIDTEYSNKCIEYIDSYNQAVSDTVNSPDYPQNVVYPEYKLPERKD